LTLGVRRNTILALENSMRSHKAKFLTILAGALTMGPAAHAQEGRDGTIARLVQTQGNVLVSREAGLASGNNDLRLRPGTRVITTAHSEVIVEYDDGCRVKLKENQRFEVERGRPCALLLAQDILVSPVAAAPLANTLVPAAIGAGAIWMFGQGGGGSAPIGAGTTGGPGGPPVSPN